MTHTEALKQALEALEAIGSQYVCRSTHHTKVQQHHGYEACPNELTHEAAITALREALAQPAPYMAVSNDRISVDSHTGNVSIGSPPPAATQHERKPLKDEEINQIADEFIVNYRIPAGSHYDFARAIEAAHGIKE